MAKPRVFISSTYYDLRQIRNELDRFIETMGYEPVRNEEGDIPYGKDEALQDYCYKEISNVDILISIIGSRYGSKSNDPDKEKEYSVSQKELKTAIENDKQVFIFIDKNVLTEYETYCVNKDNTQMNYRFVDNPAIYKFIDEIKVLSHNNNIKEFETVENITRYLKEQFAGLFRQFIHDAEQRKTQVVFDDLQKTVQMLHDLVDILQKNKADKTDDINRVIKLNHPLIAKLKEALNCKFNIYIEGKTDLNYLLSAYGYKSTGIEGQWQRTLNNKNCTLTISSNLFDEDGLLKYINPASWNSSYFEFRVEDISNSESDDLPF